MATPVGHGIIGITLARRFGVVSPFGMAGAVIAAGLPDLDVPAGMLLHRDPWKLHRTKNGTHTFGFALTAGMLAGFAGLVSAGNSEGERDVVADALTGAVLVGSHIALDKLPVPYLSLKARTHRRTLIRHICNWAFDAVLY